MTRNKSYLFPVIILLTLPVLGHKDSQEVQGQELRGTLQGVDVDKILRTPGEIIAKGENERPEGKLQVKSYRLERIRLDQPITMGDGTLIYSVYHLIITGGPFPYGYTIWVDDQALPALTYTSDQLIVQIFSNTPKFKDGATLSVTTGQNTCRIDRGSESVLPEKLSVPLELRASEPDPGHIHLRRVQSVPAFGGGPGVGVMVTLDKPIPIRNESMFMQIGREEFRAGGIKNQAVAIVPNDTYSRLPDNAQVILKWGKCSSGGEVVGRLNKGMLDH